MPDSDTHRRERRIGYGVIAAFMLWALAFISRTSFEVEGERYFCLFDDAMISMTYARNLVEGHGLNWARWGNPVEGFTCPLWTVLLVPFNAFDLPLRWRPLGVQLFSLFLLVLGLLLTKEVLRTRFAATRPEHWLPAMVLTATCYGLNYFSLLGMEVGLQFLLTLYLAHAATGPLSLDGPVRSWRWSVGGAATLLVLLRPDGMVAVAVTATWILWRRLHRPLSAWVGPALAFFAVLGGYELFRVVYFGDLLPNTYYLKLGGIPLAFRIVRGLAVAGTNYGGIVVLLLAVTLGAVAMRRVKPALLLFVSYPIAYFLYSIYVGGDTWEVLAAPAINRFVAASLPLGFVAANALLVGLWPQSASRRRWGAVLVTAAAFVLANGLQEPSQRGAERWAQLFLLREPSLRSDHALVAERTLALSTILKDDARVSVVWAGIPGFFTDYELVDTLGYNDRDIAHGPPARVLTAETALSFYPGHEKWNYELMLSTRRPDLVFQLWVHDPVRLRAAMRRHGYHRLGHYWVRGDSTALR